MTKQADDSAPYFSIGLTGGIGCGKSTVANLFAARGATIVDTDEIAHSLTAANGAAMPALLAQFGARLRRCARRDGPRQDARSWYFPIRSAKARLEAILHPRIRAATLAAAAGATGSYVIFAVPLLVESGGWVERVNRVLVIDCLESLQVARVMQRNGLSEAQVKAIMATQATRAMRLAAADDVIDNNGDLAALEPQIALLHEVYLAFSKRMAGMASQHL